MVHFFKCFEKILDFNYFLLVLRPFPRRKTYVYLMAWWCHLFLHIFWLQHLSLKFADQLYSSFFQNYILTISSFVGLSFLIGNAFVGIIIVMESCYKKNSYLHFQKLQRETDLLLSKYSNKVKFTNYKLLRKILIITGLQFGCDGIKAWAIYNDPTISPVFWIALPQNYLLRFRYIQLIGHIMKLNNRAALLKNCIMELVELNAPKSVILTSEIWRPYQQKEYDQINMLRLIYNHIFESYKEFNNCYGWGVLGLFLMSFLEFVANAYWTLARAIQSDFLFMYVYNGGTTLSLGTLITMLFWYAESSVRNSSARFHLLFIMFFCFWILWIIFITIYSFYVTHFFVAVYDSIGGIVSTILFFAQISAHFVILLENFLYSKYSKSNRQETNKGQQLCGIITLKHPISGFATQPNIAWHISGIMLPMVLNHIIVAWSVLQWNSMPVTYYWHSLPSEFALQLKLISFLAEIMQANAHLEILKGNLQEMGTRNWKSLYGTLFRCSSSATNPLIYLIELDKQSLPEVALDDMPNLVYLKSTYSEIYRLFDEFNHRHGFGLLAISIVFFLDLICNSYWIFNYFLSQERSIHSFVQSAGFVVNVVLLLTSICWQCQRSYNYSRYIGCLICKLMKPLGNKRYNDLVCEFSLQTLHQHFIITAKDFFNLNLQLLSSMVAAIVTYLVILIQFMFVERSVQEQHASITINAASESLHGSSL